MKTTSAAIILLLCLSTFGFSQSYNTTFGLRMGTDWGISFKQRLLKRVTFEAIAQTSTQREEFILTGLVEKHMPILTRRFNIYWGGGLHKGWIEQPLREEDAIPHPFGVTLIAGGELTFARINLSYDFKPAFNISGGERQIYTQAGVTVRYVLNKRSKQAWEKKNKRQKNKRKSKKMNKNSSWKFWKK